MTGEQINNNQTPRRFGCFQFVLILLGIFILAIGGVSLWVNYNVYARLFNPTHLNENEQKILDAKMRRLEIFSDKSSSSRVSDKESGENKSRLEPEGYTEINREREIRISEKELNALISKDEEVAQRVALDLSDDLISILMLVPLDQDFPLLGGKTLRFHCGITLKYESGKPVVAIRGISIGGIPLPGSWWGNVKNMNLVQEFGSSGGFWDLFSKGVDDIEVKEGSFLIKLKE